MSSKTAEMPPLAGRVGRYRQKPPLRRCGSISVASGRTSFPPITSARFPLFPTVRRYCVARWRVSRRRPDVTAATANLQARARPLSAFAFNLARQGAGSACPCRRSSACRSISRDLWGAVAREISNRSETRYRTEERSAILQRELVRLLSEKEEPRTRRLRRFSADAARHGRTRCDDIDHSRSPRHERANASPA